jgi:NADH-quinone oxidoreductase subunit E
MTVADVDAVLRRHPAARRDALIPLLQEVQETRGYLSREAILQISRHLNLPAAKVYGVATFYSRFRFRPPGKFHVQVCRGTGCHVAGSARVLQAVVEGLGLRPGETSRDGLFSLEAVACLGARAQSPVVAVNGEFHAGMTPDSLSAVFDSCRAKACDDAQAH